MPRYGPCPGERIDNAVIHAVEKAAQEGEPVAMNFNGIELVISPDSNKDDVIASYFMECDKREGAYRESPQGQAQARRALRQKLRDQRSINVLIGALPAIATRGGADLVKWIGEFSSINDNAALTFDKGAIVEVLKAAGYKRGENVSNPAVHTDRLAFERWLVGQAMGNLEDGLPIHPIAQKFAGDYAKMESRIKSLHPDPNKGAMT